MRIVNRVSERIASGIYRPGDRLPSESQFCAEFGVSPMTLRRAINILVDRGLVATAQGKGTFVRSLELSEAIFRLQQLTDQWADASVDVRLLQASIVPASERVAQALRCPVGERTVFLRRLLLREGVPLMYHREHLIYDPRRPLVESQLQITSLEGLLRAAGGEGFRRGDLSIQAVNLNHEVAGHLNLPVGTAAFCLEHLFYGFSGTPVSWGWLLSRPDQLRLTTHLGADLEELTVEEE